jgi:phage shock protein A
MSHGISGWTDLFKRKNAALQTAANLALTDRISAEVVLAQATQGAQDQHANVQRSAGRVHAQLVIAQQQHEALTKQESELQSQVAYLVTKYGEQMSAGDTAGAAATKAQGAAIATQLSAKQNELHACEALIANMQEAVATADTAAAASDQALQDAQTEAARLRSLKVQASMARATTAALTDLTTATGNGATATLEDARGKIEGDYADAMGMQTVLDHSGAAQSLKLQVEMHKTAGADLFDQAVAAAKPAAQPVG